MGDSIHTYNGNLNNSSKENNVMSKIGAENLALTSDDMGEPTVFEREE
jgi:hypothetical protein